MTNYHPLYFPGRLARPGFNSGIDLELYLIPRLIPGIGMGMISFKEIIIELELLKRRWN